MVEHWIVEADGLEMRYHTHAEGPNQAITNWFADLREEEISLDGGLVVYDNNHTEEYISAIAFAAIRRKLISNGAFYKVLNDAGMDIDEPTYELLKANKGNLGVLRRTENGLFQKIQEEREADEDEWNNW